MPASADVETVRIILYEASRIDIGLWGCWSTCIKSFIAYGPKDKMNQLACILNDSKVDLVGS